MGRGCKLARARIFVATAFIPWLLLAPAAIDQEQVLAQALPPPPLGTSPPGFVPPYEIMRTVRAVGLDPLAPPLREGTTYVLRATDYRGILMRVVVDANTGTIRAVNRIVPAPAMPGQIGMLPPYGSPPDDMPPYGTRPNRMPPELEAAEPPPDGQASLPPPPFATRPSTVHGGTHSGMLPLPRPRPAALASRRSGEDTKPEFAPHIAPTAPPPSTAATGKPDAKSDQTTAAPASQVVSTPVRPSKTPPGPPIND